MPSFKKIVAASTTAIAAATLSVIATDPASAATSHCPKYYACIWRDTMYETAGNGLGLSKFQYWMDDYAKSYGKYEGTNISGAESASSLFNNGGSSNVMWSQHPNYGGDYVFVGVGKYDGNIHDAAGVVTKAFHDRISSGKFV
jgi:hypothetical protein